MKIKLRGGKRTIPCVTVMFLCLTYVITEYDMRQKY